MRFLTLVAFIFPLSALAATVFPVGKLAALEQLNRGLGNATTAFHLALNVVSPGRPDFKALSSILNALVAESDRVTNPVNIPGRADIDAIAATLTDAALAYDGFNEICDRNNINVRVCGIVDGRDGIKLAQASIFVLRGQFVAFTTT